MNLEFFTLNGHGQFIWPAFIITFTSCFLLFLKTKKKLEKMEKIFLQHEKQLKVVKIKTLTQENGRKVLSGSAVF